MTAQDKFKRTFSHLHASEEIGEEVLNMTKEYKKTYGRKFSTAVAAACAVVLIGSTTAVAAATHFGFFKNAFGSAFAGGQEELTETKYDAAGNVVSAYTYPTMEHAELNEQEAERLAGEYVRSLNQTLTIGDWNWSLGEYLIDDNGMGSITVRLSNPNGIADWKEAYLNHKETPVSNGLIETKSGLTMDVTDYVVEDSWTDTSVDLVYYFAPFGTLKKKDTLSYSNIVWNKDGTSEEKSIELPSANRIGSMAYEANGAKVKISPVGIAVTYPDGKNGEEYVADQMMIRFKDGTEYTVLSDKLMNSTARCNDDEGHYWYVFNRLIDPENISQITINGHADTEGEDTAYSYQFVK